MTRTQRAFVRRWRSALLACTLVALAGAVIIIWARISSEAHRADQLAAEADRRGGAVTTLATDVRRLRAQVKGEGKTPVAPDPSRAIDGLRDRVRVPVPIPGPSGATGSAGKNGAAGKDGSPGQDATGQPGQNGADGADGAPGVNGKDGEPGRDGVDGKDGVNGKDGQDGATGPQGPPGPSGQSCPEGYSWQTPDYDPDAKICRRDGAPQPSNPDPSQSAGTQALWLDPRKRW